MSSESTPKTDRPLTDIDQHVASQDEISSFPEQETGTSFVHAELGGIKLGCVHGLQRILAR